MVMGMSHQVFASICLTSVLLLPAEVDTKRLRAFQNAVDSLFSQQKVAAPIKDYSRNAKISRHHLAPAIPRILHQVYLGGQSDWIKTASAPETPLRLEWPANCIQQHSGWRTKFWDLEAALHLLRHRYPWFLDTFTSYKQRVQQGDAIRYFILDTHGGLYLDMDVECFRNTEAFLANFDMVFNIETAEGSVVTNAVMASVPNAAIWQCVFDNLQDRQNHTTDGDALEFGVVESTGPIVVSDCLRLKFDVHDSLVGTFTDSNFNEVIKVFDIRQWYTPCVYHEEQCHDEVGMAKRSGTLDLRRLAGYHRYQGTWKPCMGECQKPPENRTKGHQQPLQGLSRLTDL